MTHEENVNALCAKLGISNDPVIREEDLIVAGVSFRINGEWTYIAGSALNRASRLFFQSRGVRRPGFTELKIWHGSVFYIETAEFFVGRWDDAIMHPRPLLLAFQSATNMLIHWKPWKPRRIPD